MMMNHDELQVANEKQTVIAHVVSSVMLQLRIMKAVCEECKEQDDIFYHGQKNELRSQISVMIQTLNEMKAVLNLVLITKK